MAMMSRSAGSPCKPPGKRDESMAMSGVKGAGLIAGAAMTRANQVLGSGRKLMGLAREGLASSPTSQAEMGDLFDRLFATAHPYHDVHGRATLVQLSLEELRGRFER